MSTPAGVSAITPTPYDTFDYVDHDLKVGFNNVEWWGKFVAFRDNDSLPVNQTRWAHKPTIEILGIADDLEMLISRTSLDRLYNATECTYKGITLEFMASLAVEVKDCRPVRISFQLLGNVHNLDMRRFGQLLGVPHNPTGIYTTSQQVNVTAQRRRFWKGISRTTSFCPTQITSVRNPVFRYFAKIFAESVVPAGDTRHLVTQAAIHCLMEALNDTPSTFDLASHIAFHFSKLRPTKASICVGGLITIIAKGLGFDESGVYAINKVGEDEVFLDTNHLNKFIFKATCQSGRSWVYKITSSRAMHVPQVSRTSITDPLNFGMPRRNNELVYGALTPGGNKRWSLCASLLVDNEIEWEEDFPEINYRTFWDYVYESAHTQRRHAPVLEDIVTNLESTVTSLAAQQQRTLDIVQPLFHSMFGYGPGEFTMDQSRFPPPAGFNPLSLGQQSSYHSFATPIHILADFYRQFDKELLKMPAETPPQYRSLLVDYCTKSKQCLENLGFAHLMQPVQNPDENHSDITISLALDQPQPISTSAPSPPPPQRATLSNSQSLPSNQSPNFLIQWPDSGTITLDWIFSLISTFEYSSRNVPPTDLLKVLPVAVFDKLILTGAKLLFKEPNCVKIDDLGENSSVVVVGDVHGQFHDVLFLLKDVGYPSNDRVFVFNGNYVNHGAWGFETYVLLLAWKILYPTKVFLLRGNHESRHCTSVYGFEKEVLTKYGDQGKHVYQKCLGCFEGLPLATIIAGRVYTAHGGLFRSSSREARGKKRNRNIITTNSQGNSDGKLSIGSFDELSKARRAVSDPPWEGSNLIPGDVLWSDPCMTPGVSPNSKRVIGLLWGPDCTEEFMKKYDLKVIIRSHEGPDARKKRSDLGGMDQGYTIDHVVESGKLITLFSAPDYPQFQAKEVERYKNKAAYIVLDPPNFDTPAFHTFEAVLPRPKANPFYDFENVIDSDKDLDLDLAASAMMEL